MTEIRKTIVLNNGDMQSVIENSKRLIAWAFTYAKTNNCEPLFSMDLRFPHFGEVNTGGLPVELCNQRILELKFKETND